MNTKVRRITALLMAITLLFTFSIQVSAATRLASSTTREKRIYVRTGSSAYLWRVLGLKKSSLTVKNTGRTTFKYSVLKFVSNTPNMTHQLGQLKPGETATIKLPGVERNYDLYLTPISGRINYEVTIDEGNVSYTFYTNY